MGESLRNEEVLYLVDGRTAITTIGLAERVEIEGREVAKEGVHLVRPVFPLEWQPTQASLYITEQCNLNCQYCYIKNRYSAGHKALKYDEWRAVMWQLYQAGVRKLSFLGGEPFLHPRLSDLLQYADDLGFIGVELSTNGSYSVLHHNTLALQSFKNLRARTSVSVSLDSSNESCHDRLRGDFQSVLEGVRLLVQMGLSVSLAAVVTKANQRDLRQMVLKGVSLGVHAYQFNGLIPLSAEQVNFVVRDDAALASLSQQLSELEAEFRGRIQIINRLLPQPCLAPTLFRRYAKNELVCTCSLVGCPAGRREVYVLPDGSLTPCPMFIPDTTFCTSQRLPEDPFVDIWREAVSLKLFRERLTERMPPICRGCEFGRLCRGGCPALSKYLLGTLYAPDPRCPLPRASGTM